VGVNPEKVRKALNMTSWEAATDLVRQWEAQGFVGPATEVPVMSIEDACQKFLAELGVRGISEAARKKYRQLFQDLKTFCVRHGYGRIDNLGVEQLRDFRASWAISEKAPQAKKNQKVGQPLSPLTAQKQLERLRAFFRFCVESEWIRKNPAAALREPNARPHEVMPFSESEMAAIMKAAGKPRMKAMVLLLRWSGLRISDAVRLERARVQDDRLIVQTMKTGKVVALPLPPECLDALAKITSPSGQYFFRTGVGKLQTATNNWREDLSSLFRAAKIEGGHPHRFRHSFACHLLAGGTPIDRVAAILGNSPKIVEKHYSHWVKARQDALDQDVMRSWGTGAPKKPKVRRVK
jgi:integrase/recombinase XerD